MTEKTGTAWQNSFVPLRGVSIAALVMGLTACGGGSSIPPVSSSGSNTGTSPPVEYTVLYSFAGGSSDGANPTGLIQASDGNFYGTTLGGAVQGQGQYGTIYKITPQGAETVLHSFGPSNADGYLPEAGLVQASNGNLYGTTAEGGANTSCASGAGCGTIFMISPSGSGYTVLYSFGAAGDGASPMAALIQGSDGNLYGTTSAGGASGHGTVFKFDPATNTESVVYSFAGGPSDGGAPYSSVLQSSNGNFYGTTTTGGSSETGTIYAITSAGETVVYAFAGSDDGANPYAGLLLGSDGNFYGTTPLGGGTNAGTIFTFQFNSFVEESLYSFENYEGFNARPSSLIQDSSSNLYGTTSQGGTNCLSATSGGCGTVFMISPTTGLYTVLYNFGAFAGDGKNPTGAGLSAAPLVLGTDGSLYGTTGVGGTNGAGTVFKLTVQ